MIAQLLTTVTGSLPPTALDSVPRSIRKAVRDQVTANLDVIVDGQVRSNIVGIFARHIGLEGNGLPYRVPRQLGKPELSVTLADLEIAASEGRGRPLKAHITGPTVMAESCVVDQDTFEAYRGENGFERLTLDIAAVLAEEASLIAAGAKDLNIRYLQIDEPSLAYGADLGLAREAVSVITRAWRAAGGGDIILHVCSDIRDVLDDLLNMPVDILNVENVHLHDVDETALRHLRGSSMKLSLGVMAVNTDMIATPQRIAQEVLYAVDRYGSEHLWGITPNCGLRLSTENLAIRRMKCLVEAADILRGQGRPSARRWA